MKRSDGEIHSLLCELTLMMSAATATFFLNKVSQCVRATHANVQENIPVILFAYHSNLL